MKVFITGASGFIGSYLLRELINGGHDILALKRMKTNLWRLDDVKDKVQWINEDEGVERRVIQFAPEIVFNLAWAGVAASDRTNWQYQEKNIHFQQRWLDVALESGAKQFVGVGSQSEYGAFERKIDESYPESPNTAYAAVKKACLDIVRAFCDLHNINWYWFRVFPCFGPKEDDNWLIPSLVNSIITQDHIDLTPGDQKLAYLYVGEVAKAIYSPINNPKSLKGIYNISSDNPIALKQLVTRVRNMVSPNFKLNFGALEYRPGQCMYMEGDTTKLRNHLYSLCTDSFDIRLIETINYYIDKYSDGNR